MEPVQPSPARSDAPQREGKPAHRLVIVGGVAGGMSCAARARRLDENADIIVLERGPEVSFANCGLPYYVGGEIERPEALVVQTPQTLRDSLNLDVRVHHDVVGLDPNLRQVTVMTPEGASTIGYDSLVLSPGATAIRPPLPGLDSPRVFTLRTVADALALRDLVERGARRAVVLGAGFIGVEAAEGLRRQGLEVDIVELAEHVLAPLEAEMAALIADEMRHEGIVIHEGVGATAIEHGQLTDVVVLSDGARLEADIVLLSVGVRPDTDVFAAAGVACERAAMIVDERGRTSLPDVWAVGDAVVSTDPITGLRRPVALAGPANRGGRLVADNIFRPETARTIPAPIGTAIVRMGRLAAAMTGANSALLRTSNIDFHTVHLHPNQHAGYFPGAEPIHLVVHFRAEDGMLLGAQAVGEQGVDKRIDILATAIRNGMTVADLMDLDLNYSPPFGQAKDPVTLVGMAGENVLGGEMALWYPHQLEQVLESSLLLDVRGPREFAARHVPNAVNIAHTDLRANLEDVRRMAHGRPVRVMCASGVRSYLAHRVLVQAGFDSATLSGGMVTLTAARRDLFEAEPVSTCAVPVSA